MSTVFVRRARLGRTSVREVVRSITTLGLVPAERVSALREDRIQEGDFDGVDQVVRWGYTGNVPVRHVVNTAGAIHEVNNKRDFRIALSERGLNTTTFTADTLPELDHFPLVVRPPIHAQGRKLYVVYNHEQLIRAIRFCGPRWYGSELIDKVAEYRVFIVQGRVVAVANKIPENRENIAWNVARGGVFENVRWDDWPLKAVKFAVNAFNISSLDFGGVDVMVDGEGNCYVLEINSAPSLTSEYRQECMAKGLAYVLNRGKQRIPLIQERGGYKKFIHPAIYNAAIV